MSQNFPLNSKVGYIVEERLLSEPQTTNFAWYFDDKDVAEATLLEQVRINGDTRFYTAFICID